MRAFATFTCMAILLLVGAAGLLTTGWYAREILGPRPEPIIVHDVPKIDLPSSFKSCIEIARACYARKRMEDVKQQDPHEQKR